MAVIHSPCAIHIITHLNDTLAQDCGDLAMPKLSLCLLCWGWRFWSARKLCGGSTFDTAA
jgi:hypothetical protein